MRTNSCRVRTVCAWAVACVSLLLGASGRADDTFTSIRDQWKAGRYGEVLAKLIDYRKGPYGKKAEVDYMIATCMCRIPEYRQDGVSYFRWILAHYSVNREARALIEREMTADVAAAPVGLIFVTSPRSTTSAIVRGKLYYSLGGDQPINSQPVRAIRDMTEEEFASRLFPPSRVDAAVARVKEVAGPDYTASAVGRFLIVRSKNADAADVAPLARDLEHLRKFYSARYNMPDPPSFVTVYLCETKDELRRLADKVHGIGIPDSSIGYSFQNDLSIAAIQTNSGYGTFAHELFHLMAHNDFGDIPPWLDEGIAGLYEQSAAVGDAVVGGPNWRARVLREFWAARPSVARLVQMDWSRFDESEEGGEFRTQATNHAAARYFAFYLQEKGKLASMYRSFRGREVEKIPSPAEDAVKRVEAVLEKPIAEIDKDFTAWFDRSNPPRGVGTDRPGSGEILNLPAPPNRKAPSKKGCAPLSRRPGPSRQANESAVTCNSSDTPSNPGAIGCANAPGPPGIIAYR